MIVFGLSGGIASGKSFVAGLMSEHGAIVLDADRHAHTVLQEDEVREAIADRWGRDVMDSEGAVSRSAIAERVFGVGEQFTEERRFLEGLVHPRVKQRLWVDLADAHMAGTPAAVLDIPLLHEAGWSEDCDCLLFVDTPDAVRRERAAQRGWDAEELASRESAQMPVDEKRQRADELIPGDSPEAAKAAIDSIWARWVDSA